MSRKKLTDSERKEVKYWVNALLQGANPSGAAQRLQSIGVRTRGAVRTRGSATATAPSRFPRDAFPQGTSIDSLLEHLRTESPPEVRAAVAGALGEWGGGDALRLLKRLVIGEEQDDDPTVRSAALDAVYIIGGTEALGTLDEVASTDGDPTLQNMARGLSEALRYRQ